MKPEGKDREGEKLILQAVQVHHALHPSHLFQGCQEVRGACPQLGALVVLGGQEALEAPDVTKQFTFVIFSHLM